MAPKDKARAAGISASSFMDLGAELEKQKQEFAKNRAAGKPVGRVEGPVKRVAKWAKQNAGVQDRAARDAAVFEEPDRPSRYEDGRAVLERKAKKYELLKKGKTGGYSEKQYDELLVDFEQKRTDHYESDSDDVDESLTVPIAPDDVGHDPLVEYVDELGRTRTVRRSQVPRDYLDSRNEGGEDADSDAIYNPVNHFPVYQHSLERQAQILAEAAESPINVHYDPSREIRELGAGHYSFSHESTQRGIQRAGFDVSREDTKVARQEAGAKDERVEGMQSSEASGSMPARSLAMEKRKRELEERKRRLEARKRKKTGSGETMAPELSASLNKDVILAPAIAADSISLDAQGAAGTGTSTIKDRSRMPPNAADAFLAQLEHDMLKR